MNRVRIVAIAAVALGGAVVAGTKFQQPQDPASVQVEPVAAVQPAPQADAPSLAGLAAAPQPAPQAAAPVSLMTASIAGVVPDEPAAPVASASILSRMPLPQPPEGQIGAVDDPMARRLVQADTAPAPDAQAQPLDAQLQAELNACAVWLVVTPAADAILETSVYAPCDRGATVTMEHAGLTFDARIGDDGQMMLHVPALTETASISLTFADGRTQTDTTLVPDLAGIERVALHWQGPVAMQLHAYEFGAQYGEPGHVHAGNPVRAMDGGFVTLLGDATIPAAHLAQVYSYPRGTEPRTGQVTLEIEVPVTDASCGKPLDAGAIEVHGTATAQIRQIRLEMPECDGNGGFVVLPGVLPELQIALN